ncbi:MAG: hypothetical protein CM15mP128_1140 [Methanobacteriota archaeon]|nr:MAG: hypothetical protein CM15mP128_1140 [Euryarchaeota archaeon]
MAGVTPAPNSLRGPGRLCRGEDLFWVVTHDPKGPTNAAIAPSAFDGNVQFDDDPTSAPGPFPQVKTFSSGGVYPTTPWDRREGGENVMGLGTSLHRLLNHPRFPVLEMIGFFFMYREVFLPF